MIKRSNASGATASKASATTTKAGAGKSATGTTASTSSSAKGGAKSGGNSSPKRLTIGTLKSRTGEDGVERQFLVIDKQIGLTYKGKPVNVSFNTAHFRNVEQVKESVNYLQENGYISSEFADQRREYLSNEDILGQLEVNLDNE
jgi:hypothetical protein